MKIYMFPYLALMMVASVFGQTVAPKGGFVPDPTTAETIAVAVLIPVYGKAQIDSERPFKAILKDDVWTVTGTMRCPDSKQSSSSVADLKMKSLHACFGGAAVVQISKIDGRIVVLMHPK